MSIFLFLAATNNSEKKENKNVSFSITLGMKPIININAVGIRYRSILGGKYETRDFPFFVLIEFSLIFRYQHNIPNLFIMATFD
jgi:hypothetical protein